MSAVKSNGYQVGISTTPSQNFSVSVPSTPDGTLRLSRGNVGSAINDILTVGTDNSVTFNTQLYNIFGNAGGATRRNKLDNCSYQINQRNQGATSSASVWIADRWSSSHNISTQINFATYNSSSQPGVPGFMQMKCATVLSPSAGQYAGIYQQVEAYRINDTRWGNANATPLTLSFYAYAVQSGTYAVSIRNPAGTRSYVVTWSPPTLNTWNRFVFTIPPDTTGTWTTVGNAAGLSVFVVGTSGSTYVAPSAFTWHSGNYLTAPGATNLTSVVNQEIDYTGFQLELGSNVTPYEFLPYGEDLIQCLRYFELIEGTAATNQSYYMSYPYKVQKRAAPTLALFSGSTGGANYDNGNNSLNRMRCPVATLATSNVDWVISASAEI